MYQVFRVLRQFKWRGWHYGPEGRHVTGDVDQETGGFKECDCQHAGGFVFVVEEAHPRLGWVTTNRKVVYDPGLRPREYATDDDWVKARPDLMRLTRPSEMSAPVPAASQSRSRGRFAKVGA